MYSKGEVYNIVCDAVKKVAGLNEVSSDMCLLDRKYGVYPADYLYIFDIIEMKLGVSISRILESYTYEVFIINNLQNAIYDIYLSDNLS